MTESPARPVTGSSWAAFGLALFAFGVMMMAAGGLQRYEGKLSWNHRPGPKKTLRREENPIFYDRVTLGLIAGGAVLVVGGMTLAWRTSPSAPADAARVAR